MHQPGIGENGLKHQGCAMVVRNVPAPSGDPHAPPQALCLTPLHDAYRGKYCLWPVLCAETLCCSIRFMASGAEYEVLEVGIRNPKEVKKDVLECGEVGWGLRLY